MAPHDGVQWRDVSMLRARQCLVADQGNGIDVIDQCLGTGEIMSPPWREHQFDGIAQGINERVDFGSQSTAGSPDAGSPDELWAKVGDGVRGKAAYRGGA
jgi:hypothetical protein